MHTYTLDEARHIIMNCAKLYANNLLGKYYIIVYRNREDNAIKYLEVFFGKENYQHLTGIELIDEQGNIRKHVSELFFEKCNKNQLKKDEIQFKKDGTTHLKLAALPIMMQIHKVTKIAGNYNNSRPYLIADKIIGNINFCMGLTPDMKHGYYVPSSALLEDVKKLTTAPSQVLTIFSKEKSEPVYKTVRHVAKGINLNNVKLPENILEKISLEQYIPR